MTDSGVAAARYIISITPPSFIQSVTIAGTSLDFTFISNAASTWVDVHYHTSKNSSQQNFRMDYTSGSTWKKAVQTSPALVKGDSVSYWFTYEKAGLAYDTNRFIQYVVEDNLPAAPSGLVVRATASKTLTLTWTDNATNETGYRVYRSKTNVKPTTAAVSLPSGATSWTARGLTNGTKYFFWVEAYNAKGASAAVTASGTPSNVVVTPLVIDNFNSAARWASGVNSMGKAVSLQGGLYNLEGDANLYFFFNGGTQPQGFTESVGRSLVGYTHLVLVIKGGVGGEQRGLSVALNDGMEHILSVAPYGSLSTAYGNLTIPLAAFGANLSNIVSLKVIGQGTTQFVRIDEIRVQ
jgi:hypothetical protein